MSKIQEMLNEGDSDLAQLWVKQRRARVNRRQFVQNFLEANGFDWPNAPRKLKIIQKLFFMKKMVIVFLTNFSARKESSSRAKDRCP